MHAYFQYEQLEEHAMYMVVNFRGYSSTTVGLRWLRETQKFRVHAH